MNESEMLKRLEDINRKAFDIPGDNMSLKQAEFERQVEQECENDQEFRVAYYVWTHPKIAYSDTLEWKQSDYGRSTRRWVAHTPKWTYVILNPDLQYFNDPQYHPAKPKDVIFRAVRHFRGDLSHGLDDLYEADVTTWREAIESRKDRGFLHKDFGTFDEAKACAEEWHTLRYRDVHDEWRQWIGIESWMPDPDKMDL